jgi:hypothetical protein
MSFDDVARRMKEREGVQAAGAPPAGVTPDVDRMMADSLKAETRAAGRTDIIFGIILLVVGIAITTTTYGNATREGGTYIVAYGPIIVGIVKLVRGLIRIGS